MSRLVVGQSLFACLLVTCVVTAQARADDTTPARKHHHKGGKQSSADQEKPGESSASAAKATADKKKDGEKKADDKTVSADKDVSKPTTKKLKKGPFHIEVELDGVFEAQNQVEIFVRPEEWLTLSVLKAAEHGEVVKQGDLILALDTEKIDRAITDLRSELQLNDLAVKQAAAQLAALDKIVPLESQSIERTRRMTEEDWKQFQEVEKPLSAKLNEYRLKSAQEGLDYAEEEYRQLEKMYKADDLREETEKIVLRGAKAGVDRAKLGLELARAEHQEAAKLSLPRQEERAKDQTERSRIDTDFTKVNLPLLMGRHRLELEKLQLAGEQGEDRLKKLISDREAMTVKAPIDGIVYYGRPVRGKWSGTSVETLRRGAPVVPNDVLMTVVQPRPLTIRTTVPESQAQHIRVGLRAIVEPVGFATLKLSAVVQRVGAIPMGNSGFDCQLTVAGDGLVGAIVPGMNCDIKLVPYKKTDALTVPTKAVFSDDFDPAQEYVYLQGKDGKPHKRAVKLGQRNDKQVEVLRGLAAGDEILLDKPKEE